MYSYCGNVHAQIHPAKSVGARMSSTLRWEKNRAEPGDPGWPRVGSASSRQVKASHRMVRKVSAERDSTVERMAVVELDRTAAARDGDQLLHLLLHDFDTVPELSSQ
jgi:hypothetical protein